MNNDYKSRVYTDRPAKKSDLELYGWNANPWVWVIEFERVEVTERVKVTE